MNFTRVLKPLRITISLFFILVITFAFIDFRELLPASGKQHIMFFQFIPSFLKFLHAPVFIASGFIVVLILSLLVGRLYCSLLCPLGTMQDIVIWIMKKLRIQKIFRFRKPYNVVRYGILIVAIVLFIMHNIVLFILLDPYSIYGRISSNLLFPVVLHLNNWLSAMLQDAGIYSVYPVSVARPVFFSLLVTSAMAVVVIWMAMFHGRLFCNTICPVGSLLSRFSLASLFQIRIEEKKCTRCLKCVTVCKANCIDVINETVDFSRCIGCFNCMDECAYDAINYRNVIRLRQISKQKEEGRRNFMIAFTALFAGAPFATKAIAGQYKKHKSGTAYDGMVLNDKPHAVSPPGSVSHEHFNVHCTGCHLCVSVCPTHVLQPSTYEYGWQGILQPRLDNTVNYCSYDCTLCSEVCPAGAIQKLTVEQKHITQIGIARFEKKNCVVYTDETSCGACSEHCPTKAVNMVPYKNDLMIPEVTPEICIGCGACEYACPVDPPFKAIYIRANTVHQLAQKPEIEKMEPSGSKSDFPF